jgi:hypothetical protein
LETIGFAVASTAPEWHAPAIESGVQPQAAGSHQNRKSIPRFGDYFLPERSTIPVDSAPDDTVWTPQSAMAIPAEVTE